MRGELPKEECVKKVTYHIPTEQYGFVEVEMDETACLSYSEVKSLYESPVASGGLSDKEMNSAVDEYLMTNSLKDGANIAERMSPSQKDWFQTTKRAFKRILANKEKQ